MSFILDALRKSENARLRQEHPAMFDARPVAARRRFPAWFLALGLLLGLNLLALLYVLLRDERGAGVTPPVVAAPAATAPAATAPAVAAPAVAVPAAPVPTASQPPLPAPPVAPADGRPARSGDAVTIGAAAAQPRGAAGTSSAAGTAPIASAAVSTAASPAAPTRTRDDLLAAGTAVPEIQVSLHVYDADPAKRFVFLDGQRLREGDVAANGLRVERIDADGVVLDHRGSDFKVPLEP
jgi:general secretion pathway protein B